MFIIGVEAEGNEMVEVPVLSVMFASAKYTHPPELIITVDVPRYKPRIFELFELKSPVVMFLLFVLKVP